MASKTTWLVRAWPKAVEGTRTLPREYSFDDYGYAYDHYELSVDTGQWRKVELVRIVTETGIVATFELPNAE